jgi:glycosyltransferase 2 family protein
MIFGLIAFLFYLYFFIGIEQIFVVVQNVNFINYLLFYLLAIVAMLLVMLFWASSWSQLLKMLSVKLSLKNAFLYYWAGYFIDLILPCQAVCGELTRLYLVQKETNTNYGAIAAAGLTNRTIAYSISTTGLGAGLIFISAIPNLPMFVFDLLVIGWIGSVIYLGILLYLILKANAAEKIAKAAVRVLKALKIKKYNTNEAPTGIVNSLKHFHDSFEFFRANRHQLVMPYIFHITAYVLNLAIYVLIFYALGFSQLALGFFVMVYFLTSTIQGTSAAFSVGSLEILLTSVFIVYGIEAAQSGVTAALIRSIIFWFPLIVGYIIIQLIGAKKILKNNLKDTVIEKAPDNL